MFEIEQTFFSFSMKWFRFESSNFHIIFRFFFSLLVLLHQAAWIKWFGLNYRSPFDCHNSPTHSLHNAIAIYSMWIIIIFMPAAFTSNGHCLTIQFVRILSNFNNNSRFSIQFFFVCAIKCQLFSYRLFSLKYFSHLYSHSRRIRLHLDAFNWKRALIQTRMRLILWVKSFYLRYFCWKKKRWFTCINLFQFRNSIVSA